jgi:antitoxin HicB
VSREEKMLERIRNNPRDVRPDELFDLLQAEGVQVRRLGAGAHVGVSRGDTRLTIPVPHGGGHLKTPYVVAALKAFGLEEAGAVEEAARREHAEVVVHPADGGGFVAEMPSMPGCMTHGETRAEAIANLEDAKACWLEMADS